MQRLSKLQRISRGQTRRFQRGFCLRCSLLPPPLHPATPHTFFASAVWHSCSFGFDRKQKRRSREGDAIDNVAPLLESKPTLVFLGWVVFFSQRGAPNKEGFGREVRLPTTYRPPRRLPAKRSSFLLLICFESQLSGIPLTHPCGFACWKERKRALGPGAPAGKVPASPGSPRDSSSFPVSNLTSGCERSMVTSPAIRALTSVACSGKRCSSRCPLHQPQHGLSRIP